MSQPVQPAAQPQQGQQNQQPQRPGIFKMILMYVAINQLIGIFFGKKGPANPNNFNNLFYDGEPFEFKMYLTNTSFIDYEIHTPVWEETDLFYNYSKSNFRQKVLTFDIDELLKKKLKPRLYAHFLINSLRPVDSENYTDVIQYLTIMNSVDLIHWQPRKEKREESSLIFSDDVTQFAKKKEEEKKQEALSKKKKDETKYPHLKTKIWFQFIHDTNEYPPGQIPPGVKHNFTVTHLGRKVFVPHLDTSQFWLRQKDYAWLNETAENKTVNVTFEFDTYWSMKFMMENQLGMSTQMYEEWGMAENGMEELKEMVLDSNRYLFILTMIVSALHSLFEFLALKNDISFWKNVENHRGLSLRSLWFSFFQEVIILLYLFDNETSTLILVGAVAELAVTCWKLYKTTKFKLREDRKFPWIQLSYYDEKYKSTTAEHDEVANKYLNYSLIPLLLIYAIYSLIYEKHKGWYSFIIETLVGFIYLFGFIQMTPQLYINYKLKSVEHLPWRMMIYKFLNTIIDDLFSFLITMPWLKRLSVFRDGKSNFFLTLTSDIIFVIYLYQRWIYRVDKTRDPYGSVKPEEKTEEQKPLAEVQEKPKEDNEGKKEEEIPTKEEASIIKKPTDDSGVTHRNIEKGEETNESPPQEEVKETKHEHKIKKKKF